MQEQTDTVNTTIDNARTIVNKTVDITKDDPNLQLLQPTWMNVWKEVLAYVFSAVIAFDFIIAPTMTMFLNAYYHLSMAAWVPLTLQSGGLFYVSMAAILSVGAYGSFVKSRELIKNLPDLSSSRDGDRH